MDKAPIFKVLDNVLEHIAWVEENDRYGMFFFSFKELRLSDLVSGGGFDMRSVSYIHFEQESADLIDYGNTVLAGTWVRLCYQEPLTESEFDELVDLIDLE